MNERTATLGQRIVTFGPVEDNAREQLALPLGQAPARG